MTAQRRPPALVVGVGWATGVSAIRSLARAGVEVLAVDHRQGALGFRSRRARPVLAPDRVADPDAFVSFLAELGDDLPAPAPIFPTHDEDLNLLARSRERLGERFRYPFPVWDVLAPIQSKRHQLEQASALGVATPQTRDAPTDDLGFPVLVKPSDPTGFRRRFGKQAVRCETRAELDAAFDRARSFDPLVQEFVPGGDDQLYTLGAYLSRDGEALGVFSGRKLRQSPAGVGTCRVGEAVWVDDVVEQGLALLRGLQFHGVAQVEFKRDPRDGAYKLMEVNPRLWQWHGLAAECGVDVTAIAYRDLVGERAAPATMNGRPRRWAITFLPGTTPALPRPPYVDPFLAPDEPRLALAYAARLVRPGAG